MYNDTLKKECLLHFQRNWTQVQFLVPMPGSSQPLVVLVPGSLMPSGLFGHQAGMW